MEVNSVLQGLCKLLYWPVSIWDLGKVSFIERVSFFLSRLKVSITDTTVLQQLLRKISSTFCLIAAFFLLGILCGNLQQPWQVVCMDLVEVSS